MKRTFVPLLMLALYIFASTSLLAQNTQQIVVQNRKVDQVLFRPDTDKLSFRHPVYHPGTDKIKIIKPVYRPGTDKFEVRDLFLSVRAENKNN